MQPHIHSFNRYLSRVIYPFLEIFDKEINTHQRKPLFSLSFMCCWSEHSVQPLKALHRKQKLCFPSWGRAVKQTAQELPPTKSMSLCVVMVAVSRCFTPLCFWPAAPPLGRPFRSLCTISHLPRKHSHLFKTESKLTSLINSSLNISNHSPTDHSTGIWST